MGAFSLIVVINLLNRWKMYNLVLICCVLAQLVVCNEIDGDSQFLAVVSSKDLSLNAANFTASFNQIFNLALSKYSGEPLTGTLNVSQVKRGSNGNPFVTLIIQFTSLSRDVTTTEMLLIWSAVSPSEASILIAPLQVVIVLEKVGASLIKERNTLDQELWIMIPVLVGTFLIAAVLIILCYLLQPKLENHITRTSSHIFRQQRHPAWVHSGTKVERLRTPREGDSAAGKGLNIECVDAATETSMAVEEHHDERICVEDLQPRDIEETSRDEADANASQHDDNISIQSAESGVKVIQTQPLQSTLVQFKEPEGVMSSTAPARISTDDSMSMYDLWYYYRAFDHTKVLDKDAIEQELTLSQAPSQLSKTLEFKHPNLLEDPTRAIVEQTGKVPPVQRPSSEPDVMDISSDTVQSESFDNLETMGTKLYPKDGNRMYGSTLKPVNTHRKDSKDKLHDEIDIAASVRFSKEAVNSSTFKQMQAELRRIYTEPSSNRNRGSVGKGDDVTTGVKESSEKDSFHYLDSEDSDSF